MADKVTHKTIGAALAAAQSEMGKALKDSKNPHFKSNYADLSSVTDACMPALSKNGIAVIQPPFDDETGRYVKTILIHGETGETLECRVPLIVQKNDMQGYGSACTYARRYGLMSMAGIAPEDDDGNAAAKAAPVVEDRRPAQNTNTRVDAVETAISSLNNADTLDKLAAIYGDLPPDMRRNQAVGDAKDKRKAEIQKDSLGSGDIPF